MPAAHAITAYYTEGMMMTSFWVGFATHGGTHSVNTWCLSFNDPKQIENRRTLPGAGPYRGPVI